MRANAARGLRVDKPGTNFSILFGLHFHPSHDPEFFAIWSTFLDFRRLQTEEEVQVDISWVLTQGDGCFPPGPLSVLFHCFRKLHWQWDLTTNMLWDTLGLFSLWQISIQELELRAVRAWQKVIGCLHQQRKGFAGLATVDPHLSFGVELGLSDEQKGLLRTAHDGTFYTQDGLKYSSADGSDLCRHCGEPDSVQHRIWECPCFDDIRETFQQSRPLDFDDLPACTRLHCWAVEPASFQNYISEVLALPDLTHSLEAVEPCAILDLFTDGSCLFPDKPRLRLASWAVVQAAPSTELEFPDCLAGGPLHGMLQTSGRAEIVAVLAAVKIAVRKGTHNAIQGSGRTTPMWFVGCKSFWATLGKCDLMRRMEIFGGCLR